MNKRLVFNCSMVGFMLFSPSPGHPLHYFEITVKDSLLCYNYVIAEVEAHSLIYLDAEKKLEIGKGVWPLWV